ncbi:TrkH family potassium uptake protein [Amaricoccus solimangrovi]|uniref:TrkH family potassium uptake protein n=1 Tax=Amaricoccus solimangrovi TaxID=2589815 RepID=A0A501WV44_9RHOB|nr:potassium transporter TrkG [Amaricoccus solimangrovi]TPE53149.1 TrkH family potassium uptake protein [Amaricoccus solimangrovi]
MATARKRRLRERARRLEAVAPRRFPGFIRVMLLASAMMLVPALIGASERDWLVARVFLIHGVFFAFLSVILGLAVMNRVPRIAERYHLVTLFLVYALLPLVLATPVNAIVPGVSIGAAYFEMLSCLTTTGATLFDRAPELLPAPLHLWRAMTGWAGGFMALVVVFAILAPMNLGGFEFAEAAGVGNRSATIDEAARRLVRFSTEIGPIYAGLTGLLAMALLIAGDPPLVAVSHAMGTLSTSGVSPIGGVQDAPSGRLGEILVAILFLPAISHRITNYHLRHRRWPTFDDPQFRLMLISVLGVTLVLYLRAFAGAAEIDREHDLAGTLRALWGGFFTSVSFLTTTGYVSADWRASQLWSNLPQPGTILMGLAVMGGGIATTAGGVKLFRLYVLYRHGLREMDLLTHPSSVLRRGRGERLITPAGARIAFIFLMLFLIAIAVAMVGLAATGLGFEESLTFAIAALTTTGPLAGTLGEAGRYAALPDSALAILSLGMIVGRMETLVVVALLNPAFWRR